MGRRLFEDLVVSRSGVRGARGYAVPVSVVIHAALLSTAVVASTLAPGDPPPPVGPRVDLVYAGAPAPPPPPRGNPAPTLPRPRLNTAQPANNAMVAPRDEASTARHPEDVDLGPDPGEPGCDGCVRDGSDDGVKGGFVTSNMSEASPSAVVRAGSLGVRAPTKLRDVPPVYPELARRAGVEGVVIIECTIDTAGRIVGAQVLKGHPLLDAAAVQAVSQWLYTPTLLNGVPVSVVMTVTVRFALRR